MVQVPFSNKDSWTVYNQLFWNSSFDPELEKTAEKIVTILSKSKPNSELTLPIQVLILGIGTGTLELPLLASIERKSKRKVNIVGIDLYKEPLRFVEHLLDGGLENIPENTEKFIEEIKKYPHWDYNPNNEFKYEIRKVKDRHTLICDDLDYERIDYKQEQNIITSHRPSKWADRLKNNHLVPTLGFDIVFSSFFFTHVDWWRTTLASALSFVRKDSLFMYSSGQGDTQLLEGKTNSKNDKNGNFTKIMLDEKNGYFVKAERKAEGIKAYRNLPKPINAVRSFSLENLLNYWQHDGLEEYGENKNKGEKNDLLNYTIINSVDCAVYINILKLRTFSAFRTIDSLITVNANDNIIKEIESYYSNNINNRDTLNFDIRWHIYIRKKEPNDLFYFNRRLIKNSDEHKSEEQENTEIKLYREYEWWTAWNEPISRKEELGALRSTLSEKVARYFNFKGVLSSSCMGGVIRDLDGTGNTEFKYFVNYLYKDTKSQEKYLKDL
jgi:hypothetical protein